MARLPSDDVLDALVDIFEDRYRPAPLLGPGWKYDTHTGDPMYSAAWLSESDDVEGHSKPDEIEIRRRQREVVSIDRARSAGRRR